MLPPLPAARSDRNHRFSRPATVRNKTLPETAGNDTDASAGKRRHENPSVSAVGLQKNAGTAMHDASPNPLLVQGRKINRPLR